MYINDLSKVDKINKLIENVKSKHSCFNINKILFSSDVELSLNEIICFFTRNVDNITHILPITKLFINNKDNYVTTLVINNIYDEIKITNIQSIAFYDILKVNNIYHLRICIYDDVNKIKIINRNKNIDYLLNKKNHSN